LSYSFYLWNLVGSAKTIEWLAHRSAKYGSQAGWEIWLAIAGGILFTLLVSLVMYILVEAPFLALKMARSASRQPA
ncbi:MAG: hypothetical protein KDK39_04050, partial [Leptospiraceae bacterium]|nr:hypothetical protein [Leptospiraceae bacterium]